MHTTIKSYLLGICWFILSLFTGAINDVISKYIGLRLHSFEVSFFRFLFSTITLIPFIIYYGKHTLITSRPFVHVTRGVLLFLGMTSWIYGLTVVPLTTATVMSFSVPLFVLVLGTFFLDETIIWQRWIATIIGFIGILVTLDPKADDFNQASFIFILSAFGFAMLDVINKKILIKESMISMLFYSSLVTTTLALPATVYFWQTPTLYELILFFVLGCSSNLMLYFLLKAFSVVDVTATAPYRYLELIISAIFSYFIFNEVAKDSTIYGALIIIPCTLFIIYSEKKFIDISNTKVHE